jgi:hypothetical protein
LRVQSEHTFYVETLYSASAPPDEPYALVHEERPIDPIGERLDVAAHLPRERHGRVLDERRVGRVGSAIKPIARASCYLRCGKSVSERRAQAP